MVKPDFGFARIPALRLVLILVGGVSGASAGEPLVYAAACGGAPDTPVRITVADVATGAKVTYQRAGADPGPFETTDVNFARVSRRLFFTLRTPRGLIEFQGRATTEALTGVLSDDHGAARSLRIPLARQNAAVSCDGAERDHR